MNPREREQAIRDEILNGNFPEFLRKLVPVELHWKLRSGKSLLQLSLSRLTILPSVQMLISCEFL